MPRVLVLEMLSIDLLGIDNHVRNIVIDYKFAMNGIKKTEGQWAGLSHYGECQFNRIKVGRRLYLNTYVLSMLTYIGVSNLP